MKRVLLVGGSRHGQWLEVARTAASVKVTVANPVNIFDLGDSGLGTEVYYIERVPVQFEMLRTVVLCGSHESLPWNSVEKAKMVVAALFQRDIAETFREGEWHTWD